MKLMTALVVFALSTGLAWGATEPEKKEPATAQQESVAKTKSAVKSEKKEPSPAQIKQREKMKTCSAEAGKQELKGDERKKFMSTCLKKDK
jgi:type IV secretory pathway VirB10-like protein